MVFAEKVTVGSSGGSMSARIQLWSLVPLLAVLCLNPLTPTHAAGTTTRLVTKPLQGATLDVLACRIVNVGAAPILITIEVVNSFGQIVGSSSSPLASGDTAVEEQQATGLPEGGGYCEFSGEFRQADVRASIELISHGQIVESAPAQER
jgi:hypothetical protein